MASVSEKVKGPQVVEKVSLVSTMPSIPEIVQTVLIKEEQ
jgi:hypothetical protein